MEYSLVRSRRKTLSIAVECDLQVTVRAPLRMSRAVIEGFVAQSEDWVRKQRDRLREQAELRVCFSYSDGDRVPVDGEELPLATGSGRRAVWEEGRLLLPESGRPAALAEYLRERTRERTARSIARFAQQMGVSPTAVRITSAATRWGSCSGRNSINFSYRVACLPGTLLDYIVVHELAHIREHNHSDRFWAVVAAVLPDYAARRAALRRFQQRIPF